MSNQLYHSQIKENGMKIRYDTLSGGEWNGKNSMKSCK